jgi:hypothetical protein
VHDQDENDTRAMAALCQSLLRPARCLPRCCRHRAPCPHIHRPPRDRHSRHGRYDLSDRFKAAYDFVVSDNDSSAWMRDLVQMT